MQTHPIPSNHLSILLLPPSSRLLHLFIKILNKIQWMRYFSLSCHSCLHFWAANCKTFGCCKQLTSSSSSDSLIYRSKKTYRRRGRGRVVFNFWPHVKNSFLLHISDLLLSQLRRNTSSLQHRWHGVNSMWWPHNISFSSLYWRS